MAEGDANDALGDHAVNNAHGNNQVPAAHNAAAMAHPTIMAVALKLPTFWHKNARFWFTQADSQFALSGITTEETKFHHVVRILDADTAERVMDRIAAPRKDHEYEDLKEALLTAFDLSKRDRAARLANMGPLGDRKPSALLAEMKALLGSEPSNLLFEHHWLHALPDDVRIALSQREDSLDDLAKAADKMWREKQLAPPTSLMAAAKPPSPAGKDQPNPDKGICYFHRRFGAKAKNCRQPCTYTVPPGNATAGQ